LVAKTFTPPPDPVAVEAPRYQPEFKLRESKPAAAPAPKPVAASKPAGKKPEPKPAVKQASAAATVAPPPAPPRYQPEFDLKKDSPPVGANLAAAITSLGEAKKAYKEERISKDDYKHAVARIEKQMEQEVDQAKRDYKGDKISKKEYKDRIEAIEKKYK
jgi:hypothetical protein